MKEYPVICYDFVDKPEAESVLRAWRNSLPPNVADYPSFVIDHIEVNPDNLLDMTIWLKLKKDD